MEIQEKIDQQFKEFLKKSKISDEEIRNNPLVLEWVLQQMREIALVLYELGGSYRDLTDNELLKAPGNQVRNSVWKIRDTILPCAQGSLYDLKRMNGSFERAKELITLRVKLMDSKLKN